MKRSRKSNRVSWAPGVNLCQVKLFLREDCPAKVGGKHQDTLQAKTSGTLHPSGMCANNLPPGFEGGHFASGLKYDLAQMPRIQWTCPPKVVLNFNWQVAAGEESKEVEAQKLREIRVLEAVYPHLSVIPPSPSVSRDVEVEHHDDSQIPLVPLTPIEDEERAEVSSDFAAQAKPLSNFGTSALLMPPGLLKSGTQSMPHCPSPAEAPPLDMLSGVSSDVIAAASAAALTAALKSKEHGSLIDTDLLVKILRDPKMVEKLVNNHGYLNTAASGNVVSAPIYTSEPERGITSLPCPKPATISSPMLADRNSNHLQKVFRPASSMPASRADTVFVSMPMRVESPLPFSSTDINMISGHKAANSNTHSSLNQMQPALSMMPVQPNSVQKVRPAIISSTPMQLNTGPAVAAMKANPVKDANYIKNLIREHGKETEEAKWHNISQTASHFNHLQNLKLVQNLKPVALKTQFQKPCMYFNSKKGCRQGSNCTYLHDDKSFQWQSGRMLEAPSVKRMKLGREITGSIQVKDKWIS
ncbi:hypothetical protein REPUB_Repub09cG0195000 [Reevesia pubescens]